MQLRKRDVKGRAISSIQGAADEPTSTGALAPALPATPQAATEVAAGSSASGDASPPPPPRKKRKAPQDIGIPGLLLGTGAEAAEVIDRLPLREARFTRDSLQTACDLLATADPKLAPLIQQLGPPERLLGKGGSNFATLSKAIVFQQLATTAAAVIYGRVLAACSCTEWLSPAAVLAAPTAALRQAGLSERKVSYLQDLAAHFSDGRLSDARIAEMDEAALERALCQVRGIGLWTCHMHAMFHLGSPDVLPTGDLGVRRGMQVLYGLKELPDAAAMEAVAEKWRPFRSLGSYYMWKVEVPRAGSKKKQKGKKA
ncbi:hypothetical protein ABPG77_003542 [Micractinium sp. CCAP 211/92]